ncbi:MAG: type II secretion system minor pseudopilin GspJ [Parvularculaceae bacterium]
MRGRERGFTLPELLVALFIFSLIATASVYALRLGVEARDQLADADRRHAEIELARALIRDDMAQLVQRSVRDEFGAPMGPPFEGGSALRRRLAVDGERLLLSFVRGGWANPEHQAPRSDLQYVEYIEKSGALLRRIRPYLDAARGQPAFDRVLFRDARDVEISFLVGEVRGELDWAAGWPLPGRAEFPRAMTLAITTARYGALVQRFWIGEIGPEPTSSS